MSNGQEQKQAPASRYSNPEERRQAAGRNLKILQAAFQKGGKPELARVYHLLLEGQVPVEYQDLA